MAESRSAIEAALGTPFYEGHELLEKVLTSLKAEPRPTRKDRIALGRELENSSLLSHYMSRSRKRDSLENRVQRCPHTLAVEFSPLEKEVYKWVTDQVREQSRGLKGARFYSVVSRQVQLSSCMVAALRSWSTDGGFLDEVMWEALGVSDWTVSGSNSATKPQEDKRFVMAFCI